MKVYKNKKDVDVKSLIVVGAIVVVVALIICAVIFIPKIVGETKDDGKVIITTPKPTQPSTTPPDDDPVQPDTPDYSQKPGTITGIIMSILPKTTYYVDDEFDPKGAKIQVVKDISEGDYFLSLTDEGVEVTGFDSSEAVEEQVITVTYEGFTTTFTVTIKEYPTTKPTITSIEVVGLTTTYTVAEWKSGISISGAKLKLTYSDESTEEIPLRWNHIDPTPEMNAPGTTEIIIRYGGKTITVPITIE